MSFLDHYYSVVDSESIAIDADQGSRFAKDIAGDFNPIHDQGAKRFCVPGDLLFAIALCRHGLSNDMQFSFLEMVNAALPLRYAAKEGGEPNTASREVTDPAGRPVLRIQSSGNCSTDTQQIENLVKNYVRFSGQNFPHILVPLMKEHRVMINPSRPLVIYESMSFTLQQLDFTDLQISLENTSLAVNGKRGDALLNFSLRSDEELIGSGTKKLVLSGLREYDETAISQLSSNYLASKEHYQRQRRDNTIA